MLLTLTERIPDAAACERGIERLIACLVVFMPLALGPGEARSEMVLFLLTAALSVCFLLWVKGRGGSLDVWTTAYLPLALFILVAAVQLMPLPLGWLALISSNTAALKTELLGDVPDAQSVLDAQPISFYPYATWHDLRLVCAVAVVFIVVLNVYTRHEQIVRLLGILAASGAAVVAIAVAQDLFGNGQIYWCVPTPHGAARSGPFVNHSHYAQYVSLSIGAALGLLFVKLHEAFADGRTAPTAVVEYLGSPESWVVWGTLAMVVVGAATVLLCMRRGGMISMMIAGAFMALMVSLRFPLKGAGWILVLIALGAFLCVLYLGFDAVFDRLATLGNLRQSAGGRGQIVKDVAVAWTKFPWLGTGLGTHEMVYPMFDRSAVPQLATHAENEYAQTAEETGILGLLALVAFGVVVWRSYARATRIVDVPVCSAVYGLGFGLMAVLVHSLRDFGQHVPANAVLSAVFCALLIRLSHCGRGPARRAALRTMRLSGGAWAGALAAVCLVWVCILFDANSRRVGESHWRKVLVAEGDLRSKDWRGSDAEYVHLIREAEKAAGHQPQNIQYRHWLSAYRWYSLERAADPNTRQVKISPEMLSFAERIVGELNLARTVCPTFGATWSFLGQLERSILGQDESGSRHIRVGRRLAPCDPITCLVAGTLDAEEGDGEAAFSIWSRAVMLDEQLYEQAASLCVTHLGRPDLALDLAGEKPSRVIWLASYLETTSVASEIRATIVRRIQELLEAKCEEPEASADVFACLASVYERQGDHDKSIRLYRRALMLDHSRVDWRFCLASVLAACGQTAEAMEEAKTCLRLRPQYTAPNKLIKVLSTPVAPLEEELQSR